MLILRFAGVTLSAYGIIPQG